MKYLDLQAKVKTNIFTFLDIEKIFSAESLHSIKIQLSRFAKKGLIKQIKRELYCFDEKKIDELVLAGLLYQPSYISLESALNYYGIIPDIPQAITLVSLTNSKKIKNDFGSFYYSKIKKELFFGFTKISPPNLKEIIRIAKKEKALLDYFYIRKIKKITDLRLNLKELNHSVYQDCLKSFPEWIKRIEL
ncbi:hypothetical protein ISS85_04790 [Candidatus Microgenomates bacterium]|nr:hypothetical protein [Candidatus Microgenomates bacterium]